MKKILLVPLLCLTISSCTFGGKKTDGSFSDLYTASTHSSIASLENLSSSLGINRHETINWKIHTEINIANAISGSLDSEYKSLIDWRNSESTFSNLKLLFTSIISSGSLSADEVWLISHSGESFVSYKNLLDVGTIPEEAKSVLKKYENTWLSIFSKSQEELSADELIGYNIGKNLVTKSLSDLEKYITDYPIWKNTADLGMSGSMHYWAVEIDNKNIVSLAKKLSLDLAGTGMTNENVSELEKSLSLLSFSGKLWFDPANPKNSILEGSLTASGKLVADIMISKNDNGGTIHLVNSTEKTDIALNYGTKDNKSSFDLSVKQKDIEMGKANAYIEMIGGKFHELSIEASSEGKTVSLKHTLDGDKFVWKLSAIVGSIDWSGMVSDGMLNALKIDGTSPFGTVSVNLIKSENKTMISGPVLAKMWEETVFSANVGLEVAREKFAMILDTTSETSPIHFSIDVTAKSTPSDKKVTLPTNTKSIQDLYKEINALSPSPEFSDVSPTEDAPAWKVELIK